MRVAWTNVDVDETWLLVDVLSCHAAMQQLHMSAASTKLSLNGAQHSHQRSHQPAQPRTTCLQAAAAQMAAVRQQHVSSRCYAQQGVWNTHALSRLATVPQSLRCCHHGMIRKCIRSVVVFVTGAGRAGDEHIHDSTRDATHTQRCRRLAARLSARELNRVHIQAAPVVPLLLFAHQRAARARHKQQMPQAASQTRTAGRATHAAMRRQQQTSPCMLVAPRRAAQCLAPAGWSGSSMARRQQGSAPVR